MHPVALPALIKTPSFHSCVCTEDSFQTHTAVGLDLFFCTACKKNKKRKNVIKRLSNFVHVEFSSKKSLVQRFLLDPDGGAVEGQAVPQVPAQDVLAELGRVDAPAAGRPDAEALLEEAFEDLRRDRRQHPQ